MSSRIQNARPWVAGDQVALLHGQVVDRHRGKIPLQPLPVGAVVERHPDPALGPGIEQPGPNRILADHPGELSCRESRS